MRWILVLMIGGMLLGCGNESRQAQVEPETSQAEPSGYLTLRDIHIRSDLRFYEQGFVILVNVTSSSAAMGATIRYPEDGVVITNESGAIHTLRPRIQIPYDQGVMVEVVVLALPNLITEEALSLLQYAADLAFTAAIPTNRISTHILEYALSRASGVAKDFFTNGREIGAMAMSAQTLAQEEAMIHEGFILTIDRHATENEQDNSIIVEIIEQNISIVNYKIQGYHICSKIKPDKNCTDIKLNLRNAPCSLDQNIITELRHGEYVTALGEEIPADCGERADEVLKWVFVRTQAGQQGYVSASRTYLNPDMIQVQRHIVNITTRTKPNHID